ncbi:hypothetical protein [Gilliamella sp. Occ4-3]|uniref:hypothetical protein n=1 Tax=Gilliamella sp. Occ4-3 TaxID=3120254 RepID=UPI00080E845E|nr:hypothetical protein [Gilliamella apicola]OCG77822.1 hypothetical protein A9G44_03740 [Gilliamella apicola]
MAKKNKSKKTISNEEQHSNRLDDSDIQNHRILLRDLGLFILISTSLMYFISYEVEIFTAIHYGFDIEFISLSTAIIIRNNSLYLFTLILCLILIIFDYLYSPQKNVLSKKFVIKGRFKKISLIILMIVFLLIAYILDLPIFCGQFLLPVIFAPILLVVIFYFSRISKSSDFMNLFSNVALFFLVCAISVYLMLEIFIFTDKDKIYQSFNYNEQRYVLLRIYDNNLVAKKIDTKQLDDQKKNYFNNEILYLPTATLEQGLIFKSIKVSSGSE